MATLARPTVDFSHASELLEVARMIMQRHRDPDLIGKTALLQGCLDLSQILPDQDYGPVLRRAITDVTAAVHFHFRQPDPALDGNETPGGEARSGRA